MSLPDPATNTHSPGGFEPAADQLTSLDALVDAFQVWQLNSPAAPPASPPPTPPESPEEHQTPPSPTPSSSRLDSGPPPAVDEMQRQGLNQTDMDEERARQALVGAAALRLPANGNGNGMAPPPRLNLKKTAVKIVKKGPCDGAPAMLAGAAAPVLDHGASKAADVAGAGARAADDSPFSKLVAPMLPDPKPAPPIAPQADSADDLAARIARLKAKNKTRVEHVSGTVVSVSEKPVQVVPENMPKASVSAELAAVTAEFAKQTMKGDPQNVFFFKAAHYVALLPTGTNSSLGADFIKAATAVVYKSFKSEEDAGDEKGEHVREKYLGAAADYLNQLPRNDSKPQVTPQFLSEQLSLAHGNFLQLCATLVAKGVLGLDNLDEVVGLAKVIAETASRNVNPRAREVETTTPSTPKANPMANSLELGAWPKREERKNVPGGRQVRVRSNKPLTDLNQLQALVWGGRVEVFNFEPGKWAQNVKFMTPEGCAKYLEDTENGIEIPGENGEKSVVFVDPLSGLHSINDVLRHAIDGGATRCIRVLDADPHWEDKQLLALARGRDRVVDRIVRTKIGDRHCIDFRFASVYHAVNFKRNLQEDEDWETCTITHASDPCDVHSGIHLQD